MRDHYIYIMNIFLLDLLALSSVFSGILVITSRNPIISVLYLIAVFVNVACYIILLGINFIGCKAMNSSIHQITIY